MIKRNCRNFAALAVCADPKFISVLREERLKGENSDHFTGDYLKVIIAVSHHWIRYHKGLLSSCQLPLFLPVDLRSSITKEIDGSIRQGNGLVNDLHKHAKKGVKLDVVVGAALDFEELHHFFLDLGHIGIGIFRVFVIFSVSVMVRGVERNCEMREVIRVFRLEEFIDGIRTGIFCLTGTRTLSLDWPIYEGVSLNVDTDVLIFQGHLKK